MKHSCYFIICFECLWALLYTFILFFGTNLLTGGPAHIAVFLPISVFQRKGISNEVQTPNGMKPSGALFLESMWSRRLGVEVKEASRWPRGWGACPPMAASLVAWRPLQVSRLAFVPKRSLPKVSFRLDSVWYSFSSKHWNRQGNSNMGWASG